MPKFLIKLADEKFCEWSTISDAPASTISTKKDMADYLLEEYGNSNYEQQLVRLERCEKTGTSALDGSTMENIVSGNRAGENEKELSIEEIIKKFSQN
jgi:hypothetical protein